MGLHTFILISCCRQGQWQGQWYFLPASNLPVDDVDAATVKQLWVARFSNGPTRKVPTQHLNIFF